MQLKRRILTGLRAKDGGHTLHLPCDMQFTTLCQPVRRHWRSWWSLGKGVNSVLAIVSVKGHRIEINDQQGVGNAGLEPRKDI